MTSGGFTSDPTTGAVTGTVPAEDPASSSFRVKFPGPRRGLVTFGDNGTYTYTPTHAGRIRAGFTAGADRDTFTVQVSGEHATTFVDVTVPVAPARIVVADPIPMPMHGAFAALSPDADRLYVTHFNGTLTIVRTADNSTQTVSVPAEPVGVAVSPDGQRVHLSHPNDNTVTVHDAAGNTLRTDRVGDDPWGLAVSHDGSKLYVANHGSDSVTVTDTATGQSQNVLTVDGPWTLGLSPDGTKLYVCVGEDSRLGIVDLQDHSVEFVDTGPVWHLSQIAVSSDGSRVYFPGGFSQTTVTALNTADKSTTLVTVAMDPSGVAVSPDGSLLYTASLQSDAISLIDAWTLRLITTIPVAEKPVHHLVMSPDGSRVYAIASTDVVAVGFVGINP